jgi:hypothetical protein
LKLDESCISNPKSEISDWTARPQAHVAGLGLMAGTKMQVRFTGYAVQLRISDFR